mmetsp:Transcript_18316/g.58344  ORF Transcript_18316/g.58344 Transcript_18316/m.58344 type:complete len:432 (+) Transcript_18316:685-1980(+)
MQVVERAVDHLVIIERGRHVQRAVCHEHLPVELAQPLSHPVAQAVVGGDAERCSRLRAAGALAFDVAQVADSGAHPFGRLRDVPDVGLVDELDDVLEEGGADDLVAHDQRDDASRKVGAPHKVGGDRLGEAERDARLSEKGHPVAVVVLGWLATELAANPRAEDDEEGARGKEEDAGGAVAPQHAQVHRDAREGEEEEVDRARQVRHRLVEGVATRSQVARHKAGYHAADERVDRRTSRRHLLVPLVEEEGEPGEEEGCPLRHREEHPDGGAEKGGQRAAPPLLSPVWLGDGAGEDERHREADQATEHDREEGLLHELEQQASAALRAALARAALLQRAHHQLREREEQHDDHVHQHGDGEDGGGEGALGVQLLDDCDGGGRRASDGEACYDQRGGDAVRQRQIDQEGEKEVAEGKGAQHGRDPRDRDEAG